MYSVYVRVQILGAGGSSSGVVGGGEVVEPAAFTKFLF